MTKQRSKTKSETQGGDQVFLLVRPEASSVWGEIKQNIIMISSAKKRWLYIINLIMEVSYEELWLEYIIT